MTSSTQVLSLPWISAHRRRVSGAVGVPTLSPPLQAGELFVNEVDTGGLCAYYGAGNDGNGNATSLAPVAGIGAFHAKGRVAVSDAAYTIAATSIRVVLTAITAARVWSLPPAASFDPRADLWVYDESGALSSSLALTIAAAGTDTITGLASIAMTQPYQKLLFHSNGSNLWTYR